MSDSESDVAFESADEGDEGKEVCHPSQRVLQNSNNEVNIERLCFSNKKCNDEIERHCETNEKERTECSHIQEGSVFNTENIRIIENLDADSNSNRKVFNENDEELMIIQDCNKETVSDQDVAKVADNSKDLIKPIYAEDSCISEKQTEAIEKVSNEERIERPEYVPTFGNKQSSDIDNSSNIEKHVELGVKETDKNKNDKSERVVLKFEKKLSEKSKHKYSEEMAHTKQEHHTAKEQQTLSWGWGNWSSSLLATAASSVSAFTSQVSEGFGTVLETVESTLGAPPPEELAAAIEIKKKERSDYNETKPNNEVDTSLHTHENSAGLLDGVSSLSKAIENTGSKVLMTGLDTLELIGKTTFDILTEGDPGLRKKRAYFNDSTNLSEVLREAKEKAESHESITASEANVKSEEAIHYSTLFDNFQGIVHLEALEILSRQNKTVLQGWLLSQGEDMRECKERINEVQEICDGLLASDDNFDEESHHEFVCLIKDYTNKLELNLSTAKLEEVHVNIDEWLKNCQKEQDKGEAKDATNLYHEALKSMAQLTACSMELFHKVAEMILYKSPDITSAVSYATYLTDITGVLCFEVGLVAAKFCHCLNTVADDSEDPDSVAPLITNVYLEASNSSTYIQDAFQLLVPILQVVSTKQND